MMVSATVTALETWVSAVKPGSNMVACNRLQSDILDIILERIDQVPPQDLSISIGSLSGSVLLAGRSKKIRASS